MSNNSSRMIATLASFVFLHCSVKHVDAQFPASLGRESALTKPTAEPRPCVLLHNDNVLYGVASQQGEYVIVQRGDGNEIRLPRKDVACWAPSIRDLYRYRVDHRQQRDPAAHIKDAHWCIRFELYDFASEEIQQVFAIDPRSSEANRLERQLLRILAPPERTNVRLSEPASEPLPLEQRLTGLDDVDLGMLRNFSRHVQPTLVNRCGSCHSHTSDRLWKLTTPSRGSRSSSRMTRENLASSMHFINRESPLDSELLQKSITPHGGVPAPLDPRRAKALAAFRGWLISARTIPTASVAQSNPSSATHAPAMFTTPSPTAASVAAQDRAAAGEPVDSRDNQSATTARLPKVANPFDPDLFNRRYHPD